MLQKIKNFVKKETVLTIAVLLAVISAFFVKPGREYLTYIDWRTLCILLSLMLVVAGFQRNGLFDAIGRKLLARTRNTAQLVGVLVFLCFFSSMFITNDVALLTFVPFALVTLQKCNQQRLIVLVFVLQTIAANLGSMLTPIGNPQNLYLYGLAGVDAGEFMSWMLPYTAFSGLLLLVVVFVLSARRQKLSPEDCAYETPEDCAYEIPEDCVHETPEEEAQKSRKKNVVYKKNAVYLVLFVLSLLVVARLIPCYAVLAVILVTVFFVDRAVFGEVDYCLLLTFIAFFIFIGNMGNLPAVRDTLQSLVCGRELGIGIAASQIVSNVPAALLLSGFTPDYKSLTLGVNFGGLGTLIASMASLISYKIYAHNYNKTKGIYLLCFTIANLLFLAALVLLYVFAS